MNYFQYTFTPLEFSQTEILIALLSELGFESFVENEKTLDAFISEQLCNALETGFTEEILRIVPGTFESKLIAEKNWNAEWESNYPLVEVDGLCRIRAPFHANTAGFKYDIVIEPKMSFGTAHHETTFQMIQYILEDDMLDKSVLDMGCGTGVLAILAAKKGAKSIVAVDNDEWAYRNSLENIQMNNASHIKVYLGDAGLSHLDKYDVLIANINRNILLNDIPVYSKMVYTGGKLYLSGFYSEDLPLITAKAMEYGFNFASKKEKNNWIAACFNKV